MSMFHRFITIGVGATSRAVLVAAGLVCLVCAGATGYPVDGFVDNWNIDTSDLEHARHNDPVTRSGGNSLLQRTPLAVASSPDLSSRGSAEQYRYRVTPPGTRARKLNRVFFIFAGFAALMIPLARHRYSVTKRVFDIIGSILCLSLSFPLMLLVALLIKLDSPGPVFYKQVRVGMNRRKQRIGSLQSRERRGVRHFGRPFTIYKFRTMCVDAESKSGPVWAKKDDNRVTRIGRVLRKTRIDELPQFINVLKGDMCIIGPRPERPVFINQLNDILPNYAGRLQIRPGITGLAQVRYQYAASIEDAKKKLRYDLVYVRKMCFTLDMDILFNTFNVVLLAKGAR